MNDQKGLIAAEEKVLRDVAAGGLMQKIIPADIQERLIDLGYIEQKLGGLAATPKGILYTTKSELTR